jgi:L-aminopeptidase/D-esterase-like protein
MPISTSKGPARDFGILFNDMLNNANCKPALYNSITDVSGVCVGHANYMLGNYYINNVAQNPVNKPDAGINTGVTAILPLGMLSQSQSQSRRQSQGQNYSGSGYGIDSFVPAGLFVLNGDGEMTGAHWVEESGILEGPIMLTNTYSVGTVRTAVIDFWKSQQQKPDPNDAPLLPVIAENYDGYLNDIIGAYENASMAVAANDALSAANPNIPAQGNVGGGTGMTCYSWKGGIGTSSRVVQLDTKQNQAYTVGVLVQANQGTWNELLILGAPLGPVEGLKPDRSPDTIPNCVASARSRSRKKSSIIVVIATDAPIMPHQLKRLARRAALGIARTGTSSHDDSGEICIAFSTANQNAINYYNQTDDYSQQLTMLPNDIISPCLFTAAVDATEEAIINALIAAQDLEVSELGTKGCAIVNSPNFQQLMNKWGRWKAPS